MTLKVLLAAAFAAGSVFAGLDNPHATKKMIAIGWDISPRVAEDLIRHQDEIAAMGFDGVGLSAACPELDNRQDYGKLFLGLLRRYLPQEKQSFSSDAPESVEITRFDAENSTVIHTVILSDGAKEVTVQGFTVRVNGLIGKVKEVRRIPSEETVEFTKTDGGIVFETGDVTVSQSFEIRFGE